MHFETTGLPADVHEIFFSDRFYYASSQARRKSDKPEQVGCGVSRSQAIFDMRQLIRNPHKPVSKPLRVVAVTLTDSAREDRVVLDDVARARLGMRLQTLRQARGLSQLQVAQLALGQHKSHATVSRLERGAMPKVDARVLSSLAKFFRLSSDSVWFE